MGSRSRNDDGAGPGKIFIGGLAKDTTLPQFNEYFVKYGEIIDSVIMKDRHTGQPRGFGFVTFSDPSVVDKIIEDNHIINGKQVELKRTIPKGANQSKDFKTRKIFVGGIPSSVTEDEFKGFFSTYGQVVEHQIIRDHETNRSRGFGFIVYDCEEVVDDLLSNGSLIDMAGTQVEIKKAQPKKALNPSHGHGPVYASKPRSHSLHDYWHGGPRRGLDGGFGPVPSRDAGNFVDRYGLMPGYSGNQGGYKGAYQMPGATSSLGHYQGESSMEFPGHFGPYVSAFSGLHDRDSQGGDPFYSYGVPENGSGSYDFGPFASSDGAGGLKGRGGYSSSSRYHPYGR